MKRDPIKLNNPEKYKEIPVIAPEKIEKAIADATARLERMGKKNGLKFPSAGAYNSQYLFTPTNSNWVHGMYAGCYWLAFLLTGKPYFNKAARELTATFGPRFEAKKGVDNHDVGFGYTPSVVAAYKITGAREYKDLALRVADYFYNTSYSKEGKFIIRVWKEWKNGILYGYRTMMDSLMNAPLLFWAAKESGNEEYFKAAHDHVKTTEEYLIRRDSSSFHHYQFNPETHEPMYGITLQGHSNDSCWSRGHAWGVYGFPIAYTYDKSDFIKEVHHDITYFMLNHLPEDMVPYWDYDFVDGDEPRDASAGAVAVCGLLEMARMLDENDPDKVIFQSAAVQLLEAIIDKCTDLGKYDDGLINHVTAALPQEWGIDQTAVYGDYFYLEALARYKNPDFKMHW